MTTQDVIERLGARIEQAYRLHRGSWSSGCSTPRVWSAAAQTLVRVSREDPSVPIDPELYVAAQPYRTSFPDPWTELTQPSAIRHYRNRVRRIVRALETELSREVAWAERRVRRGADLEQVLGNESGSVSPLGCFIVARNAGRTDLARRFRAGALVQHQSCPLYRQASARLLPPESYPAGPTDRAEKAARPIKDAETLGFLN